MQWGLMNIQFFYQHFYKEVEMITSLDFAVGVCLHSCLVLQGFIISTVSNILN